LISQPVDAIIGFERDAQPMQATARAMQKTLREEEPMLRQFGITRTYLAARNLLAGIAVLVAALAVAAGGASAQSDWDKVIAEAKKEGKVVIYNGTNFKIVRRLGDQFQKDYGIAVEVLDGRASEIRERIRTEQAAGRAIGDLIYSGATSIALQTAEGAFNPHGPMPLAGNLAEQFTSNGTFLPSSAGNFALLINTNLVKQDIKSWKDLEDPKWAGKILSDDPRALGGGQVWFEVTHRTFGRGFHEKIAAHKPVFSRVWAESNRRIARGEFPIYLPFNVSEYQSLKGLPVKAVIPQEGIPYVPFGTALLKDAPHPNAARLFMNFLLDPARQLLFAKEGFRPAAKDMGPRIPEEIRPLTQAKAMGTTVPGKTQGYLDLAKEIYK
jgi:iron(III) transport system substrate-binding protein